MGELPNLDMVRAMAVLSVVVEHLLLSYGVNWIGPFPVRWVGTVGVFVFFVHTALVLMWSLERRPNTLDFYIRRAFRIYPLAIAAILFTLIFHVPIGPVAGTFLSIGEHKVSLILSNLLLVQNLIDMPPIVGVMWTLALEVEMYILLPALFFYVQRNFAQWPLLVLWLLAAGFAHMFNAQTVNLAVAAPYFLSGVMAYVGFCRRRATLPAWLLPVALSMVALLFLYHPSFFRGWILCLAVGLGLPSFRQIRSKWMIRSTHELAKYSYGIYLAHPFGIVLGIYMMPRYPIALQVTVVLLSTAILSVAGYHFLEYPMIRVGSRLARYVDRYYEPEVRETALR